MELWIGNVCYLKEGKMGPIVLALSVTFYFVKVSNRRIFKRRRLFLGRDFIEVTISKWLIA